MWLRSSWIGSLQDSLRINGQYKMIEGDPSGTVRLWFVDWNVDKSVNIVKVLLYREVSRTLYLKNEINEILNCSSE